MRGSGGTREQDGPGLDGFGFGPAPAACPWGCTLGPDGWSGAPFCPRHRMSSFADLPVLSQGPSQTGIQCKTGEVCFIWDDGPGVDYYPLGDYDDDDDYDEDESDGGLPFLEHPVAEESIPYSYCGFRKSFLCSAPPLELPRTSPTALDARLDRLPIPCQTWLTEEEAQKNAQELVAEEERAKRKAEKKKLKKKKQKDRKKREKLGQEQKNKKNTDPSPPSGCAGAGSPQNSAEDEGCSPESSLCPGDSTVPSGDPGPEDTVVTEEELDLSCTFVCKAREKAGVRLPPPGSDRSPETQNMEPRKKVPEKGSGHPVEKPVPSQPVQLRPPSPSTLEQSLALAGHGIEAAQIGQHTEAVWAFTVALELNPWEHRLLGNRSYCLEKLGRYEEALADAEAALALRPGWPKGSFRKGKALRGLKRYAEAVRTFEELLLQDGAYAEAATQLEACQALLQQCSRPGGVPVSPFLLKAKEPLFLPGWAPKSCQDAGDKGVTGGSSKTPARDPEQKPAAASGHPTLPPSHPARDCFPLWVGNITSHINEKVLRRAFGRFGEIRSMRLLPRRHCAFINFSGKAEAEEAFKAMQVSWGGLVGTPSTLWMALEHPVPRGDLSQCQLLVSPGCHRGGQQAVAATQAPCPRHPGARAPRQGQRRPRGAAQLTLFCWGGCQGPPPPSAACAFSPTAGSGSVSLSHLGGAGGPPCSPSC
ncbi:tetratricopeptide repeat protein 31 isoform X3 [Hirundo rustica]|uniref:tetratricopeptide repeat protein 31 isoform X3 n=1 Tax=Hirundo rustica TaxID=43150 RepID=UPI001A94B9B4|nr:tetratricopeptide repeat protein 31 isoform X3 [Hirundo rustica]